MTDPKGTPTSKQSAERQKRRLAVRAAKEAGKYQNGKDVHHKDGNRNNNSPSNIAMTGKSAHGKKHGRGHKRPTK